jgi:hypothetical protein
MARQPKTITEAATPPATPKRVSRAQLLRIEGVTDAADALNSWLETKSGVAITAMAPLNHYYLLITYEETV